MIIRDNGSSISFLINSHNSSTFVNDLEWGYTVNGFTNNDRSAKYSAGAGWVTLDSFTANTSQTVTFRLFDTGTSGLGGPTTLSASINRDTEPGPPNPITFSSLTATLVIASFTDGSNGGDAIDARQIAYHDINTTAGAAFVSSDRSTLITGLKPGTTY